MALEVYIKPQRRSPSRRFSIKTISDKIGSLKVHQNALLFNSLCSLPGWGVSSGSGAFLQCIRYSNSILDYFNQLRHDLFKRSTRSIDGCCNEWHRKCEFFRFKLHRCGTKH
jgi:hypothetical protein